MTAKADEDVVLRLPADAKQSLTDGIADVLEQLSVIAQQLGEAVVDEEAECPPELATRIDELADDLDELADEFAPSASPMAMRAKGEQRKARKAALAKAKGRPFPGAAPLFGKQDEGENTETEKDAAFLAAGSGAPMGSPPGAGAGPEVKRPPPGEGPGAGGDPQPRGTAENPDVVMKAGRKMARERLDLLQQGHDLQKAAHALHEQAMKSHDEGMAHLDQAKRGAGMDAIHKAHAVHKAAGALHEEAHKMHGEGASYIEKVLKEVGAPGGFMQPPGPASREQPPSPKPSPAEPMVSPRAAAPDPTGLSKAEIAEITKAAVDAALQEPLAELAIVRKELGAANRLATLRDNTGTPRSLPSEEQPRASSIKPRQTWPSDMSAEVKRQRAASK